MLQEEIIEDTAGLDGPLLAPTPPSTPNKNSEAKDANPWEASWGDLLSSQESDTEFDRDSTQSSTGASTADAGRSGFTDGASSSTPSSSEAGASGRSPTKVRCKRICLLLEALCMAVDLHLHLLSTHTHGLVLSTMTEIPNTKVLCPCKHPLH